VSPKLPRTPPADLARRRPLWKDWEPNQPLWHVANSKGAYAARFAVMRSYGPLPSARFDPHPPPPGLHPTERVLYAASNLVAALAERFQKGREIRRHQPVEPVVYAWTPTRPLRLLDLTGRAATRLGASHTISAGPKDVTRSWARALRATWPTADGLFYSSAMTGEPCFALWAPAQNSFPAAPAFSALLSHPATSWNNLLRAAAAQIGYDLP
jgi:hypothetical protein